MPIYDFQCQGDTPHYFEFYLPLDRYRECPPCPTCGASTERHYLPQGVNASRFANPIVVFQAPDGSYRFPGDANGRSAHEYSKKGFKRIDCHDAADVRRLEKHVNQREYSRMQRSMERQQQASEESSAERRSQFAHEMGKMSNLGKDVAREAIRRNNQKSKRSGEPGFHVDVLS